MESESIAGRRAPAPAEGERRALGGYHPQYRFAAALILRSLREGMLEWVRLADPEAGRVDDVQLGTPGRVDAYQVKWSRNATTFTFNEFVAPQDKSTPSLIAQLADGWRRLAPVHKGRRIVVHLATNDYPSTHDRIKDVDCASGPCHIAEFLESAWNPIARTPLSKGPSQVPARWSRAWSHLVAASGLDEATFTTFVRDCQLDFGLVRPDAKSETVGGPPNASAASEALAWREDLDVLALKLYDLVTGRPEIVEVSRDRLLQELRWEHRAVFRSRHEFPEPEIPYREVGETVADLRSALSAHPCGYVLLIGTPGSGKSTLLTQTLRYHPGRIVRYYAYVPDSLEPNAHRGEAISFLHDLSLSFDRLGIVEGETLPRDDERLLAARVHAQLRRSHERYVETGERTIVVIDGLDHIIREQHPQRSLLAVLPDPAVLLDGVYIVLGSQTDKLPGLPAAVRSTIESPARRVEMRRLSREAVVAIIELASLDPSPEGDDVERIVSLSNGHPLAVAYTINKLRGAGKRPVNEVLAELAPFRESIDAQYEAHWYAIESERQLVRLLALLARVRGGIDRLWLETWADPDALYALRRFEHYFRREPSGRWYFFHNSFRAFLLARTRALPGVASLTGDHDLYRELAERCAAQPDGTTQRWDELYYRAAAGDDASVLRIARSDWFRAQFFAGRPSHLILSDVRRAVRAAGAARDVLGLVRLTLVGSELGQRFASLPDASVTAMLLALGDATTAVDRVHDGNRLLIDPVAALEASATVDDSGLRESAERIFTLAEPLELLNSRTPPRPHEVQQADLLLDAWIDVAGRFRSVDQVLSLIERVQRTDERRRSSAEEATRERRSALRFRFAGSLRAQRRWDDVEHVVAGWDPGADADWAWWFWAHAHGWRTALVEGDRARARELLRIARAQMDERERGDRVIGAREQVEIWEAEFRLADNETVGVDATEIAQPPLVDLLSTPSASGFAPFQPRFQRNRLLAALGDERPLSDVIPMSTDPQHEGLVYFERAVVQVARLWGRAWAGQQPAPSSVVAEARGVLRLFARRQEADWRGWYLAQDARGELYTRLIQGVSLFGDDALLELRRAFEREWRETELAQYWPAEIIRQVVVAFVGEGAEQSWAASWLHEISPRTLEDDDHETRLKHAVAQFHALIDIGDVDGAREIYRSLLDATLTVGYKDAQLESWIAWGQRANAEDPAHAHERLAFIAKYLPWLDRTTDRTGYALVPLLRSAYAHGLETGAVLTRWYLERGLVYFTTAVEELLRASLSREGAAVATVVGAVHRHFLLPLDTTASPEVFGALLAAEVHASRDRAEASDRVAASLAWVEVAALPSTRSALRRVAAKTLDAEGMQEEAAAVRAQGDSFASSNDETRASAENPADHLEGDALTLEAAQQLAASVDGMRELLSREKEYSYLRWATVFKPFVQRSTRAEVFAVSELRTLARRPDRWWEVDLLLSERLAELGDGAGARELAERAFVNTGRYGWQERYDGGGKVLALRAIVRVDSKAGRERAWRALVDDISSERLGPGGIVLELEAIVPVLGDEIPAVAIWSEVASYLEQLFARATAADPPSLPTGDGANASRDGARVMLDFAAAYLDHPVNVLAIASKRAFVDCLLDQDVALRDTLSEMLVDSARPQRAACLVLEAVAGVSHDLIAGFRAELRLALESPDLVVRRAAASLLNGIEPANTLEVTRNATAKHQAVDVSRTKLPPVYEIAFEARGRVHRLRDIRSSEPLPPTTDAAELVGMWRTELDRVANAASVQPEALYQRVVQLMDVLHGASFVDNEMELQRQFAELGLRQARYRRPRSMLVRRAMGWALCELVDAGRIALDDVEGVTSVFRDADPAMLRLRPGQRPSYISAIRERIAGGDGRYVKSDWTSAVDTEPSILNQLQSEGWVIIAEQTKLRWLNWDTPTERRTGARVPGEPSDNLLLEEEILIAELCEEISHVRVADYWTLETESDLPVVVHEGFQFDTPGQRWLAFNPAVARDLGWQRSSLGLFQWLDASGSAVAESVWWEDGNPEMWPYSDDEVGAGWFVRISDGGWEQLRRKYETLTDCVRLSRETKDQEVKFAVLKRESEQR